MNSYFFRVEHDLLRSEAFKTLGGSAIKVYLVIGLYSDFGTDWAYPSIRTIARQAGLSRQTVLAAIEQLTRMGLLATSKAKGRSTAYRIIRQAPERPPRSKSAPAEQQAESLTGTGPRILEVPPESVPESLEVAPPKWSKILDRSRPRPSARQAPRQAQTRTNIERRPDSIDPDSGNTVPPHGRGPSPCCCGFAGTADQSGNPRPVRAAARGPERSGSRGQGAAQRLLSPESGQASERPRLHPGRDRGWLRPAAAGRQPAGKPSPRAGSPVAEDRSPAAAGRAKSTSRPPRKPPSPT